MPFGGNDWLALTQEPTLEPEIPIGDAHHHFWDFRTERIPYQRYLLHELAADVNCGHNVRSTVFIEARSMYRPDGAVELRPLGEIEFVQGLAAAAATGLYGPCHAAAAIIGHADLKLGDRVAPVLEALQAASPTGSVAFGTQSPGTRIPRSRTERRKEYWRQPTTAPEPGCLRVRACPSTRESASRNCPSWLTLRTQCLSWR